MLGLLNTLAAGSLPITPFSNSRAAEVTTEVTTEVTPPARATTPATEGERVAPVVPTAGDDEAATWDSEGGAAPAAIGAGVTAGAVAGLTEGETTGEA